MAFELVVIEGPDSGGRHTLQTDVVRIGRHTDNDVILADSAASRFHAEIQTRGEMIYLVDLGSTHGTYVNEVRNNQELLLSPGDQIRIGQTIMAIEESDARKAEETTGGFGSTSSGNIIDRVEGVELGGETMAFAAPVQSPHASSPGLDDAGAARLSKVAKAIQSVFELDDLMGTLMDLLFDVFQPERGMIMLRDDEDGPLKPHVVRPGSEEFSISQTILDYTIREKRSLLVADAGEDSRFNDAESVMSQSILSAICAPLVSKDRVLGILYLDSQSHQFSFKKEDLALLSLIAAHAGIAIENAILVSEKVEAERLAAIGVAIAGISHYAKNILTGIKGASSLIEHGLKTENLGMIGETWPILQRSNAKIVQLIQDMLTYSKRREPTLSPGSLNALAREIEQDQAARAEKLGVNLVMDLEENISLNMFDAQGLHDTLLNLVGNAIEACDGFDEACVTIHTATQDKMQLIEVRDNGPGIPEEVAKKIFQPFFSTKGSKGTGLGLAVARKCAEEHGGSLDLETQEGLGTTFTLSLPVVPVADDAPGAGL